MKKNNPENLDYVILMWFVFVENLETRSLTENYNSEILYFLWIVKDT